jgi:hypothetical protein
MPNNPNQTGIGIGFSVFEHSGPDLPEIPIHINRQNIGPNQIVYNGELAGIINGIKYASTIATQNDHFNIYSDNQAAIN